MEDKVPAMPLDGSKHSPGPNIRKMKQSRLPFQFLSTSAAKSSEELSEARKRKPSTEAVDVGRVAKAGRISEMKENGMTLAVEGKSKPAPDIVKVTMNDEDDPSEAAMSSSGKSVSAGKTKRKVNRLNTDIIDSTKILIKLPIGKRKRNFVDKMKPKKKKAIAESSLDFRSDNDEVITLDDSDLSEDGTDALGNDSLVSSKNEQSRVESKQLHGSEQENNKISVSISVEEDEEIEDELNKSKTQTSSSSKCVDDRESSTGMSLPSDGIAGKETSTNVVDQSGNLTELDTSSNIDSSEEDIYLLCTPDSKIVPNEEENKMRKLTPKQLARRQDYEKRRAQKQLEKQERRRKLQEEREEKAREKEKQEEQRKKERIEKEDQKRREREEKEEMRRKDREEREEQKRKEREEKEEYKRKEREEKDKRRQIEIEQKNEEKRLKEEERRKKEEQKEEERKRKEEEKEAEEKRKQKVAQAFTSFFVKKSIIGGGGVKASDDENSVESSSGGGTMVNAGVNSGQLRFMPFCVKGDMRLAPTVRRVLHSVQRDHLDKMVHSIEGQQMFDRAQLYLEQLKRKLHKPLKTDRTWNVEDDDENDDIMVVDENVCHQIEVDPVKMKQKFKTKFFLFEENRRPPYRGTWRKRSACIKARRPFVQDNKYFDYEVDSDDEWEEEEPGESLHGSDDEKDVDPEEEYEVDNEFFVPHGHLSDEELHEEEEGEIGDDNCPESQKFKLKIMQQEFVAEMKKKTEKIKPRLIGCIWEKSLYCEDLEHANRFMECSVIIRKMLDDRAMLYDPDEPISFTKSFSKLANGCGGTMNELDMTATIPPSKELEKPNSKKIKITDDAVRDLARLMHGNVNNRKFLVREFHAFWASRNGSVDFSLESIRSKIKDIAQWGTCRAEGPMEGKLCWTVEKKVLQQYDLMDITLPNDWKYHLQKRPSTVKQEKKSNLMQERSTNTEKHNSCASKIDSYEEEGCDKSVNDLTNDEISKIDYSSKTLSGIGQKDNAKTKPSVVHDSVDSSDKDGGGDNKCSTVTNLKNRVPLLMSVPRGQNINQSAKNSLISQFLRRENSIKSKPIIPDREKIDGAVIEID
ncbi:chromatin assembly factor 1 subunit A [Anopheles maculipalpis]|uniref:chromatin assembly factor 1 subunit A n=1 Tax=Anopheles maculipalpis TaxID=1496333 RepID=UPI002158D234|nr:chromatin assembly factor 1 subunit A [Anopheles maculipalpis]